MNKWYVICYWRISTSDFERVIEIVHIKCILVINDKY